MSVNWLAFSKVFVFISVFGRFSVDERRKRIKMYAFSNENALVWMGLIRHPTVLTLLTYVTCHDRADKIVFPFCVPFVMLRWGKSKGDGKHLTCPYSENLSRHAVPVAVVHK